MKSLMNKLRRWLIYKLGGITGTEVVRPVVVKHEPYRIEELRSVRTFDTRRGHIEEFMNYIEIDIAHTMASKMLEAGMIRFQTGISGIADMIDVIGTIKIVVPEVNMNAEGGQPDAWRTV